MTITIEFNQDSLTTHQNLNDLFDAVSQCVRRFRNTPDSEGRAVYDALYQAREAVSRAAALAAQLPEPIEVSKMKSHKSKA